MWMKKWAAAVLFAVAGGMSGAAEAQTKLNFTTPYPEKLFHVINIREFIKDVHERSGGKIEITLHTAESLFKHADTMQAIRSGQVDLADWSRPNGRPSER